MNQKFAIAIHGGSGTLNKERMTEQMMREYKQGLEIAINAGLAVLKEAGPAVLAVEEAVVSLENNPLFNAGKGSVLTNERKHEMDAAIMNGIDLSAGAVAGISGIKNPVKLARCVMNSSEYVFLCGSGAIGFGRQHQLEFREPDYFTTREREEELEKEQKEEQEKQAGENHQKKEDNQAGPGESASDHNQDETVQKTGHAGSDAKAKKFGTVGAVALDQNGNLAAATSTGGLTNKKFGRVGDTPVVGGGTYANNHTCAVSCTGEGEEFIRAVVAYDISSLIEYKGLSLAEACRQVMQGKIKRLKGSGGLIAVDRLGNVEMPFNTEGMYRASFCGNGRLQISIFEE